MTEVRVVKKRKDFIKVAKQGEKVVQPTLILQAAFNLSVAEDTCQIGYTVTKKIGKAHVRNQTKRRLRAAARNIFSAKALAGVQYVIIGRYNTASCPFDKLTADLLLAVKRINKILQKGSAVHEQAPAPVGDSAD